MPETPVTLEEASKCRKCGATGTEVQRSSIRDGGTAIVFNCMNRLVLRTARPCEWYKTGWVVQVDRNGNIPQPDNKRDKTRLYPKLDDRQKAMAQRQIDDVLRAEAENE